MALVAESGDITFKIIGAESLGVRGMCCQVSLPGRRIRNDIIDALKRATDVVFSHFHGDHIPLKFANPFQLSIDQLPGNFSQLHACSLSAEGQHPKMRARYNDLATLMGGKLQVVEGVVDGPLSFSRGVPHGTVDSGVGKVMMTHVAMGQEVFVHASDIQLLDDATIDLILTWQPDIVFAAGPPLYLDRLVHKERQRAWSNALRLWEIIPMLILHHHLMRSSAGLEWLDTISAGLGKQLFCAADFMHQPRCLLEASRVNFYESMPVPEYWHEDYFSAKVDPEIYREQAISQGRDSLQ